MQNYEKQNVSRRLIESEGWTRNLPDALDSRIIYPDCLISTADCDLLRSVYGYLYG